MAVGLSSPAKVSMRLSILIATVVGAPSAFAATLHGAMLMPVTQLQRVTSPFGERHDGFHPGIDLAAPWGSPVVAAETGTVVNARRDPDYGIVLDLKGLSGSLTRYAHLSSIAATVHDGIMMRQGALLGEVGETGNATGPHLHFEVRIAGTPVNPGPYVVGASGLRQVRVISAGTGVTFRKKPSRVAAFGSITMMHDQKSLDQRSKLTYNENSRNSAYTRKRFRSLTTIEKDTEVAEAVGSPITRHQVIHHDP